MWVRTTLSIGVRAAPLMHDKTMHSFRHFFEQIVDDKAPTSIVSHHYVIPRAAKVQMARTVAFCGNRGSHFEFVIDDDQGTFFCFTENVEISITVLQEGWVVGGQSGLGSFFFGVVEVDTRCLLVVSIRSDEIAGS